MQSQLDNLDGIELKIRQLVQRLSLLKEENMTLLHKNSLLNKEIEKLKINIEGMNSKTAPVKEPKVQTNGDLFEKQEFRSEIDSYIEEIDKCIEILKLS
jgi:regulator of replication initiation timing